MSNAAIFEELDEAIEQVLGGEAWKDAGWDIEVTELLPIAEELRMAARPEFRDALLVELTNASRFDVEEIFTKLPETYPVRATNFAASATLHAAALLLLVSSSVWMVRQRNEIKSNTAKFVTEISPYLPVAPKQTGGGGGGGDHDRLDASKGDAPRFAQDQITPPAIVVRNNSPKLTAEPTVVGPPDVRLSNLGNMGDPLSRILTASNGVGASSGIGAGTGGGVGSGIGTGIGPGYGGGLGGGIYRVGSGVTAPRVIYDPDPQYSEEARKAKVQGVVVLAIVVGRDGRAHDPRVARSLGMGLDEKAMEAVKSWKFEPALKDGHPVAVLVNVEVNFRLF